MGIVVGIIFAILFYGYFVTFIALGIIQPIQAIAKLLSCKRLDSTYAIGLKKYIVSVALYILGLYAFIQLELVNDLYPFFMTYILLVPWFYVVWFIGFNRKWRKKRKNIKAFDQLQLINAPHEDRLLLESYPTRKVCFTRLVTKRNKGLMERRKAKIRVLHGGISRRFSE